MNLKPVQLRLETGEVRRILQASLDDDAQDAVVKSPNFPLPVIPAPHRVRDKLQRESIYIQNL